MVLHKLYKYMSLKHDVDGSQVGQTKEYLSEEIKHINKENTPIRRKNK